MFVDLTNEEQKLSEKSRRLIADYFPFENVRKRADGVAFELGDYTQAVGRAGWFSRLVPAALSGANVSGGSVVDAAIVAWERGRTLQPGGFVGANVTAFALARAGDDDMHARVLSKLVMGEETAAWAVAGAPAEKGLGAGVHAVRHGNRYVLRGRKSMVQDVDTVDWLLITADIDGGLGQFLVSSHDERITRVPKSGLDLTRTFGDVILDDVAVPASMAVGSPGKSEELLERQLSIASVLTAAEAVGAMETHFQMALGYAKERIAFGRPIGSFQAVKHLLADTSLMLEMSKAAVAGAARAIGDTEGDEPELASIAKAFVSDAAIDLAQNCFQVFGGIGFMWTHDQHLFLRRLTVDAALYGSSNVHRERLCRLAGL